MEWLSELKPAEFWTAITAIVGVAGIAGGLTSWIIATYLAWRRRPEADWSFDLYAHVDDDGTRHAQPKVRLFGEFSNVGDAPAHSVRLTALAGPRAFEGPIRHPVKDDRPPSKSMPLIKPGDSFKFEFGFLYPRDWSRSTIEINWITPPTRLKKSRTLNVRLVDYCERPLMSELVAESRPVKTRWFDPLTGEEVDPHKAG